MLSIISLCRTWKLTVPSWVQQQGPQAPTRPATNPAYYPEFLNVTDNPLLKTFDGKSLLGAYEVDDEGVPAQAVNLVVDGKLQNYLIGREPVKDFSESNGHGRSAPGSASHSRSGVMIVKPSKPISTADLNKRLLTMAKEQGRDVYAVETLGDGELTPRLLYRVHANGTRELVRGASFDELDNRSLRSDIVAAGDDPFIANSMGTVLQTTITPSLLFDDIGVKRATEEQQKLPYYSPPAINER